VIYGYIFITSTIAITEVIIDVKRINAFFPVLPPITIKRLIEFFKSNNNAVRKKKEGFFLNK
jgi:hypothetical protein